MGYKFRTLVVMGVILIFSFVPTNIVKAAKGDFYNLTKHTKYAKEDIISNQSLVQQLGYELGSGDKIAKEISNGKVIDYVLANNKFEDTFVQYNDPLKAILSVINDSSVYINKQSEGLDNYEQVKGSDSVFDLDNVY